jgi:transposase
MKTQKTSTDTATATAFVPTHTLGIDLGDKRHFVCVMDHASGKILEERSFPNTREQLLKLAAAYPQARVAIEVETHSPWISRVLEDAGLEVIVTNARKLRAIYRNDRKSDELDARMLAKLARADITLLHPLKHGDEQAQRDLLRIKLRDNLVRQRVNIISAVRFTLKSLGIRLQSPSTACFAKRARNVLKQTEPEMLAMRV